MNGERVSVSERLCWWLQLESSSCSDGHLSDIMPDVAMATASFGQLQLQEQELELDLGDGNPHLHGSALPPFHRYLGPGPPPPYLHCSAYHTGPPRFI
ncbi:hypothetical protein PR048_014411 [Dryococelus australis]|uniref:Uncharacterized protein n=1 Tax=Dryococelus australis TaxID=614101 RepID=A0ABQ9HE36_9NEOP|nr:hypothetical protein PR048_014411 [Dryococelus australis]